MTDTIGIPGDRIRSFIERAFRPSGHLRRAPRAGSQVRSMTRKPSNRPIRLVDRPLQHMRSLPSSGSSRFLRE
jgi:hypothetical protein